VPAGYTEGVTILYMCCSLSAFVPLPVRLSTSSTPVLCEQSMLMGPVPNSNVMYCIQDNLLLVPVAVLHATIFPCVGAGSLFRPACTCVSTSAVPAYCPGSSL
jgi:hypothetical protein